QGIAKKISFALRTPALVVDSTNGPTLIVRNDAAPPGSALDLVRSTVYFDDAKEIRDVNFKSANPSDRQIAIRFLQFMVQAPLATNRLLWQPGAGKPFYEKKGELQRDGICKYT